LLHYSPEPKVSDILLAIRPLIELSEYLRAFYEDDEKLAIFGELYKNTILKVEVAVKEHSIKQEALDVEFQQFNQQMLEIKVKSYIIL
jgi:hypothetical protein